MRTRSSRRSPAAGDTALVQPHISDVAANRELALVFIGGRLSHVMRKRPVLDPDEIAPVATGHPTGVAAVMLREDLAAPAQAPADAVPHAGRRARRGAGPIRVRRP